MKNKNNLMSKVFTVILVFYTLCIATAAYCENSSTSILISNVKIFNGKNDNLQDGMNILVVGNKIVKISKTAIQAPKNAQIIDGRGRVLMPGMIDTHTHITMEAIKYSDLLNSDREYIGIVASNEARRTLLRGFTTIRDMAGASFGVKRAIDEDEAIGPRIYPSGAALSQTSGHMDLRGRTDSLQSKGGGLNPSEKIGAGIIADGAEQVMTAAREQLRLGASQIKVMAGGGIASNYDPIDVTEYTEEEIHAAVVAAANWGTYVAVHVYTPESIRNAINAGAKSIEHANLIDEPTMKLLADKQVFLSPQVVVWNNIPSSLGEAKLAKARQVAAGLDQLFALAKKYHVKITFGTDLLFDPQVAKLESKELTARLKWFTPAEILKQATSTSAELLALSGRRNPYPGKLGVIEEGALADMLLVDGNPLQNLQLLEDPERNLKLIMKDGKIYKNTLKNP